MPELGSCEETSVGRWQFLCCTFVFQFVSNSIYTVICFFFFKANCFGAIFCCLRLFRPPGLCYCWQGQPCFQPLPLLTVTCSVVLPAVCWSHEPNTLLTQVGGRLTVEIWTSQILRVRFRNPGASQAECCAASIVVMDLPFNHHVPSTHSSRVEFYIKVSGPFVQGFCTNVW